jgi:acetyltransferase-like isoleucine patch superfamily enzyme
MPAREPCRIAVNDAKATMRKPPPLSKIVKVLKDPNLFCAILNAQYRMRRRAAVPLSVRLVGKVRLGGGGDILFGEGVTLVGSIVPLEFLAYKSAHISVGDHTFINYGTSISAYESIKIGSHCHLGHYSLILDNNEHDSQFHGMLPASKPVVVEDHVWIGSRVTILPGVRIGQHSTIGAGSVVTKSIPAFSVAVGNPARVVRSLPDIKAHISRTPIAT